MKKLGFIDLETLPGGTLETFTSDKTHPKNFKDQKKIDEWYKEQEENKEEDYKKWSVDTNNARILTLGLAIDERDPYIFYNQQEDEIKLLEELQEYIFDNIKTEISSQKTLYHDFSFVGHNIKNFDLKIILVKCFKHPERLKRLGQLVYSARQRYSNVAYDTMEIWTGGTGMQNLISMDTICRALNIEGKGDFDGSMVYDTWKNGEIEKIIAYQRDDVICVRKIFNQIRDIINVST